MIKLINKKQLLKQIDNILVNNNSLNISNNYLMNKYVQSSNSLNISNDIRGFLLTSPLYGNPNSYSQYINQNKNNEMYQYIINNKPRLIVKNMNDVYNKYFKDDKFTFKSYI